MRCHYCDKSVFSSQPVTVPGIGPSHAACHQINLVSERIFAGINLTKLDDDQLGELMDLVRMEQNVRTQAACSIQAEMFNDEVWL